MDFKFDMEANKDSIDKIKVFIKQKQNTKGALMPVLQEAQKEFGYLPLEILQIISRGLNAPMSDIYGVATFYSQFSFIPKGQYDVGICLGTACYVRGAQDLLEETEEILNIKAGGTTPDMKFSISATRCIGACALAPVITVNDQTHGRLNKGDMKKILEQYK